MQVADHSGGTVKLCMAWVILPFAWSVFLLFPPPRFQRGIVFACQWFLAGNIGNVFSPGRWKESEKLAILIGQHVLCCGTLLDCYWVGSLDFNYLVEIKLGFPKLKPTKSLNNFLQGVDSNKV